MPHTPWSFPSKTGAPASSTSGVRCRFCRSALHHTFVDLGLSPLCESYIEPTRLAEPEALYPLRRPDCLFILSWNLLEEIVGQMAFIRERGGRFLVAIPEVRILA